MAWITPVTDRDTSAVCTYSDMNRIAGNINYIYPGAGLTEDYGQNDATDQTYVTASRWQDILDALETVELTLGFNDPAPTELMTYDNFNLVEELTLKYKIRIDAINANTGSGQYTGEDFYSASPTEIYSQGG